MNKEYFFHFYRKNKNFSCSICNKKTNEALIVGRNIICKKCISLLIIIFSSELKNIYKNVKLIKGGKRNERKKSGNWRSDWAAG